MFHYLYYKLYQASLRSSLRDIPEFMTAVSFGVLIIINFLTLNALLTKLNITPYIFSNSTPIKIFPFLIIGLTLVYYNKKRRNEILKKYSQEDNRTRIKGNIIITIYVIISILLMFIVPLFKPGEI